MHCFSFRPLPSLQLAATVVLVALSLSEARATETGWMRGGNWADARDNYVDGLIVPSGLTEQATPAEAREKAHQIARDLKGVTGGGRCLVRLGINPQSVLDTRWWPVLCTAIDTLNEDGADVLLACWEGTVKDGRVDDPAQWKAMWQAVQSRYGEQAKVWYEPLNEPFGYTTEALVHLYQDYLGWIGKPKDHLVLAGTGYSDHVSTIGDAFPGCKLGLHIYPWYGGYNDENRWKQELLKRIGAFADRTVITEMGAPATTGLDFSKTSTDVNVAFIRGVTVQVRELGIGLCYWPSHRLEDTYRLFKDTAGGGVTNTSLQDRLHAAWRL